LAHMSDWGQSLPDDDANEVIERYFRSAAIDGRVVSLWVNQVVFGDVDGMSVVPPTATESLQVHVWTAPGWQGESHVADFGRCSHVGMDGPTFPGCRLVTRSGVRFGQRRWNMTITVIGLDLAKNVFQVHGIDENGHAVRRNLLVRRKLPDFRIRQYGRPLSAFTLKIRLSYNARSTAHPTTGKRISIMSTDC
jgi:hypothetical protein